MCPAKLGSYVTVPRNLHSQAISHNGLDLEVLREENYEKAEQIYQEAKKISQELIEDFYQMKELALKCK